VETSRVEAKDIRSGKLFEGRRGVSLYWKDEAPRSHIQRKKRIEGKKKTKGSRGATYIVYKKLVALPEDSGKKKRKRKEWLEKRQKASGTILGHWGGDVAFCRKKKIGASRKR